MKYAMLPWMDPLSAGKIIIGIATVLILYNIFEYFFKHHNLTMGRGAFAIMSNTVWPLCLNLCIFTLAYWYWAFPLAIALTVVFIVIIRGELKTAREEELEGAKGLTAEVRKIRSEWFADLPVEEQMEFKKSYQPQKFVWWLYLPLVVLIPFLIVLLLEQLGAGDYLFSVVYYE